MSELAGTDDSTMKGQSHSGDSTTRGNECSVTLRKVPPTSPMPRRNTMTGHSLVVS